MESKASFLQESDGTNSVTRLIVFIGAIWIMCLITFLAIQHFSEIGYIGITVMFSSMIGTLLTFKIIQKNIEKPLPTSFQNTEVKKDTLSQTVINNPPN